MSDGAGQRRPRNEDLTPILEKVWEGLSLREACRELGLHVSSTSAWLHADDDRRAQYARAREGRAEAQQEEALEVSRAAAVGGTIRRDGQDLRVDPQGARVLLDAIKWSSARMAPKTAPVQRVAMSYEHLSPEEIRDRMAEVEARLAAAREDDGAEL